LPLISIPTEGLDTFSLTEYFIAPDPRKSLVKLIQSPGDLYAAVIVDSSIFNITGNDSHAYIFDGFLSAIEAYCSTKANFFSDALLERALNFYAKLLKTTGNINLDTYAQASFLTAIGNSASSPGAGSALANAINVRFPVKKQVCSAVLLPFIAEKLVNARPEKMARVASFLGNTGKPASVSEAAGSAGSGIRRCMEAFNIQSDLKAYNIPLDRTGAAVEAARQLEFIPNSPWTVSEQDVFEIFKQIL
jgi:alcohol dehydrogenase